MCLALRNTVNRGRSSVPEILFRMRNLRRSRPVNFLAIVVTPAGLLATLAGLASLATNLLAAMANTLAAVGLRRAQTNDGGAGLADGFLVGRTEHQHRALGVLGNLGL